MHLGDLVPKGHLILEVLYASFEALLLELWLKRSIALEKIIKPCYCSVPLSAYSHLNDWTTIKVQKWQSNSINYSSGIQNDSM